MQRTSPLRGAAADANVSCGGNMMNKNEIAWLFIRCLGLVTLGFGVYQTPNIITGLSFWGMDEMHDESLDWLRSSMKTGAVRSIVACILYVVMSTYLLIGGKCVHKIIMRE